MADGEAERDMKDFEFLQLCKFRVQPSSQELPVHRGNLLACSSKYGLLIYCTKQGFSVVKTSSLMKINEDLGKKRNKVIIEDIPVEKKVDLSTPVLCLGINADGKYLAVVTKEMGQLHVLFYDINGVADTAAQMAPFARARINATPAAVIQDLSWNPAAPNMLAVCTSDGNVELLDVADNPKVIAALPAAVGATCFSWSPKGKQLLVGKKNGTSSQYDHALTEKKQWPCPNVLGGSQKVVDISWQSTYAFIAAYISSEASAADQPKVILVISSKEGKTKFLNFDDVCFGNGEERKAQYFFHLLLQWEMILMASSNATEATVVGKNLDDNVSWEHWNLEDCSRAELPLTGSQNDSFPVGMAVDYSPQAHIVINESVEYPACPVMYLLSTDGMLLAFHLSYRHKNALAITVPASALEPTAARKGVPGTSAASQSFIPPASFPAAPAAASVRPQAPVSVAPPGPATPQLAGLLGMPGQGPANRAAPSFQFAGVAAAKPAASTAFSATQQATQPPNGLTAQKTPASLAAGGAGFGVAPSGSSSFFGGKSQQGSASSQGGSLTSVGGSASTPQSSAFASVTPTSGQSQGTPGSKPDGQTGSTFPGLSKAVPSQPDATAVKGFSAAPSKVAPAAPAAPSIFGTEKTKAPASSQSAFTSSKPPSQAQQAPADRIQGQNVELQKSIDASMDSAFRHNIVEEIRNFDGELKQHMSQAQGAVKRVGTREEMNKLIEDTEKMRTYIKDIKSVTKSQLQEVQEHKTTLFNLFAIAEECRMKLEKDQDPHYHSLLQGQTLDPVRAERLKKLQGMAQALEESVVETDRVLNAQWDEHQARKQERIQSPTSDTIYKMIKNNHQIITHKKHQLEKLEEQLHNLKLYSRAGSRELHSLSMSNETTMPGLMENTKPEKTMQQTVSAGMTKEKVSRLKDFLSQRTVRLVKSTPLANMSMSRIVAQTPSSGMSPSPSQSKSQQPRHQSTPTGPPVSQLTAPAGKLNFVPAGSGVPQAPVFGGTNLQQQQSPMPGLGVPKAPVFGVTKVQQHQSPMSGPGVSQAPVFGGSSFQQHQSPISGPGVSQAPVFGGTSFQQQQSPMSGPGVSQAPVFGGTSFQQQQSPMSGPGVSQAPVFGGTSFQQQQSPMSGPGVSQAPVFGGTSFQQQQSSMPGPTLPQAPVFPGTTMQKNQEQPQQQQRLSGPTSFSGVGFFKQPSPSSLPPPGESMARSGFSGSTQGLGQTAPAGIIPDSATQPPATSVVQSRPESSSQLAQPTGVPVYEDVTPTETEDDEEDGSEEDNEEETIVGIPNAPGSAGPEFVSTVGAGDGASLFKVPQAAAPGTSQAFMPLKMTTQTRPDTTGAAASVAVSAVPTTVVSTATRQPASKDLFGAKTTAAKTEVESPQHLRSGSVGFNFGHGSSTAASAATVTTTASTSIFSFGKTSAGFGAGSTSQQPSSAASSQGAATSNESGGLFKFNPEAKTGFSFGGPATFGQKVGAPPAQGTQGSVFGAQATPSKNVGFGDLSKPEDKKSAVTTAVSSAATGTPASSAVAAAPAATPSTVAAPKASADTFSFSLAASTTTAGSTFGGAKPEKTAPSVFGGTSPPTSGSTFGFKLTPSSSAAVPGDSTTPTATASPVFGVAGTSANTGAVDPVVSSSASTGSGATLFGKPAISPDKSTQQQSAVPAASQPQASAATNVPVFGGSSDLASGSTTTTVTPATTTVSDEKASVFGKPQQSTFSFGTAPAASSSGGFFGSSTSTTTSGSTGSVFGGSLSSSTATGGLFGSSAAKPQASTNLFGAANTPASSTGGGGLFGSSTTTGVFGSSAGSGGGGLFGTPAATATSGTGSGGIFGTPAASTTSGTSSGGLFGATASTNSGTSSGGLFGTPAASTSGTSSGGLFGTPAASTSGTSSGGLFGTPAASTSGTSSGGLFGTPAASTSGTSSGGLFGTPAASTAPAGGLFGQQQTPAASGFGFGQQTTSASTFGQPSLFGQQAQSSSSGLLGFAGLGGKPSEEKAKQNVFGTSQAFGNTSNENPGLFGSSPSSSFGGFGSASSTSPGGGSFSTGGSGSGVASSGFGVASAQPTAGSGGFGGTPAFGSSPSFGGSAVFGSKPAFGSTSPGGFGSSPAFGSAPAFGSSTAFGSGPTGTSAGAGGAGGGGFSSFANAAAPTFGQLAQSSSSSFGGGGSGFGASPQPFGGGGGGGGGFGSPQQPVFGQGAASPGFGGGAQSSGFGGAPAFGSSPAFNSYRG